MKLNLPKMMKEVRKDIPSKCKRKMKVTLYCEMSNYSSFNRFYFGRWMDSFTSNKDKLSGIDYKSYDGSRLSVKNWKIAYRLFTNFRCYGIVPRNMKYYLWTQNECYYKLKKSFDEWHWNYKRPIPKNPITKAYTDDYIYGDINDGELREIDILFFDGNKYVYFLYNGKICSSKSGYIYSDLDKSYVSHYKYLLEEECEKLHPELYKLYSDYIEAL